MLREYAPAGMPALVGEITIGILAGPHFGNLVPESEALMLEGELALVPRCLTYVLFRVRLSLSLSRSLSLCLSRALSRSLSLTSPSLPHSSVP